MKLFSRKKKNKPLSIGIDFGTTVSRISYIDTNAPIFGIPEISPIPSIISAHTSTQSGRNYDWHIGQPALNTHDYVTKIKLGMGGLKPVLASGNGSNSLYLRPELLAAKLIWTLKSKITELNPDLKIVESATISVPAEWGIIQRQATIMSAKIAGFRNINIVEEPVAAFLALREIKKEVLKEAEKILVFDCGGGTLDITVIINKQPSLPFVAGRATDIGGISGENIDEKLAKSIVGSHVWRDLTDDEKRRFSREVVRELKEQLNPITLSHSPLAEAQRRENVDIGFIQIPPNKLTLTLEQHDRVVNSIIANTEDILQTALSKCVINGQPTKLKAEDIDTVIMVGGSSYLRPLQKIIKSFFGKEINGKDIILFAPEKLIAIGAAFWQAYLDQDEEKFKPTLSMDTYLEYDTKEGEDKSKIYLGRVGDALPIVVPKPNDILNAPILKIPETTHNSIEWKVYQVFAYSTEHPRMAVEQIKYQGKIRGNERIRLRYRINKNGNISLWKPDFIFSLGEEITPELPPLYDWTNQAPEKIALNNDIWQPNCKEIK